MKHLKLAACLAIVLAATAFGHVASAADGGPKVITADRMLDVVSGKMISPATIVVEGNRIIAVNPDSLPDGATTVALGDMTLLPGLIDTHIHINTSGNAGPLARFQLTVPDKTLNATEQVRIKLEQGFTTVRVVGISDFIAIALGRAGDKGLIASPRIFSAGHGISITGGHGEPTTGLSPNYESDYRQGTADGVDDIIRAVRYQIKHGATWIKTQATAGVLSRAPQIGTRQHSDEELKAMVDEAARHGVRVAAHAHYEPGIGAAVRAGVRSIEHGSFANDETIEDMKKRGTFLVMTVGVMDYLKGSGRYDRMPDMIKKKIDFVGPAKQKNAARFIKSGVKIAFGTDVPPKWGNKEFGYYVNNYGMDPLRAIRTATTIAAELLEVDDRGRIEAGLLADIVAVPGNPLENIDVMENVGFVMKDGRIYKTP